MPPPKDLPGFYFDPEKNRYFPVRGPIPGSKRPSPSSSRSLDAGQKHQIQLMDRRKRTKAAKLHHVREIHGRVLFSDKSKCNFKKEYQKIQASQPVVWKYPGTSSVADSALDQLYGVVQTSHGLRETKFLATGSVNGTIRLFEIGNVADDFDGGGIESVPELVWSPLGKQIAVSTAALGSIWCAADAFSSFPSNISCIKRVDHQFPNAPNASSSAQLALLTTLGSGASGGSVYVLNLQEPLDFSSSGSNLYSRTAKVASFDDTVWTADCNSNGTLAVIGTNSGSALLNLETRKISWPYRYKSDIFSLQFVQSGNIVLCGLRNGAIVPVDLRQKQSERLPYGFSSRRRPNSCRAAYFHPLRTDRKPDRQRIQANGKLNSSSVVCMPSAVCSLVSLTSDDQYFIGSSMDGSMKLFDLRLLQRGAIQSYEGHVNSHTHLQLAVDPSETLLISGGEDCAVRIWSINSGELLFSEKFSNSILTTVCWPGSSNYSHGCRGSYVQDPFELSQSWGAWLGSRDGLLYMHGT